MLLLEEDIKARPWATHSQRSSLLYGLCAIGASEATICRSIKRLRHSGKKDQHEQAKVTSSGSGWCGALGWGCSTAGGLVFVDEMGSHTLLWPPCTPTRLAASESSSRY